VPGLDRFISLFSGTCFLVQDNNVWYLLMKASDQLLWYLEATFHVLGSPEGGQVLLG
jgi:hypothetical protein